MKRSLCIFLFVLVSLSLSRAQNTKDNQSASFSASHKFVVQGFASADAAQVAQWADEVLEKVEGITHKKIFFDNGQLLKIRATLDSTRKTGQVLKDQTYVDGRLQQKIQLINPEQVDQEDLIESMVELLLNRYVIECQTSAQRKAALGRVPEWFSVGLAQNLYPQLRARNIKAGLARWDAGEKLSWDALMQMESMPAGRWNQKVDDALAVQWLLSLPNVDTLFRSLLAHLCEYGLITPEWMATNLLKFPSLVDLEKAWDLWIAQQQSVHYELGQIEDEGFQELKELLQINPHDYAVDTQDVPTPLTMHQLVEFRDKKWMRPLAERLSLKIQFLAVGHPPEYQQLIKKYVFFLDALRGVAPGYTGGLFGKKPSDAQLFILLDEADRAAADLRSRWAKQRNYLDQFEKQEAPKNFLPL